MEVRSFLGTSAPFITILGEIFRADLWTFSSSATGIVGIHRAPLVEEFYHPDMVRVLGVELDNEEYLRGTVIALEFLLLGVTRADLAAGDFVFS